MTARELAENVGNIDQRLIEGAGHAPNYGRRRRTGRLRRTLALAAAVEPVIAWCRRRMGLKRGFTAAVVTIAVTGAILALAAVMLLALTACGETSETAAPADTSSTSSSASSSGAKLRFVTGGESGTYYAFGGVLASFVSGKSDCKVTALTSGGSQANVEDLTNGNVQLAFVQSDVMNYAYNGQRLFDSPVTGFSVVAQLYQEQVQIVTTNPDIKTVADLAGKKVSIGAAGSGVYFNAIDVLSAYDLKESDISAVYQSFGDSAESLKDGKIDAAFIVAGAPTTAITDLATAGSVYLVSLDDSHVQSLLSASPYYTAATIKAGTY